MKSTTSHKTHSINLGKSAAGVLAVGGACAVCGAPCERTYCGLTCYRAVQRSGSDAERFWAKVRKADACWLWTASRSGGSTGKRYGQFTVTVAPGKQRVRSAHTYAYELQNGAIPAGLEILHTCNNGLCVRGDHLTVGTHTQNVADAVRDGLYRKRDAKPEGRKPKKLTAEQVQEIFSLHRSGMLGYRIADVFGVSRGCISLILNGKRRERVTQPMRKSEAA